WYVSVLPYLTFCVVCVLFSPIPPPPGSTLFPYTTLFRSLRFDGVAPASFEVTADEFAAAEAAVPGELRAAMEEAALTPASSRPRSEEHTSELQSRENLVCRLLLEKKKNRRTGEHREQRTT